MQFLGHPGLTFFAPGCGVDEADPFTDQPTCCGDGTSQPSAFAAAVLAALMSYDPTLNYATAEQLLVSTATVAPSLQPLHHGHGSTVFVRDRSAAVPLQCRPISSGLERFQAEFARRRESPVIPGYARKIALL